MGFPLQYLHRFLLSLSTGCIHLETYQGGKEAFVCFLSSPGSTIIGLEPFLLPEETRRSIKLSLPRLPESGSDDIARKPISYIRSDPYGRSLLLGVGTRAVLPNEHKSDPPSAPFRLVRFDAAQLSITVHPFVIEGINMQQDDVEFGYDQSLGYFVAIVEGVIHVAWFA